MRKFAITTMVVALLGATGYVQYTTGFLSSASASEDFASAQNRAVTYNMEKLMAGQDSALSGAGRYVNSVEQVPGVDRDARIPVTIEVSGDGQSYVMISESQSGQYAYAVSGNPKVIWSDKGEQLTTAAIQRQAGLALPSGIAVIPVVNH